MYITILIYRNSQNQIKWKDTTFIQQSSVAQYKHVMSGRMTKIQMIQFKNKLEQSIYLFKCPSNYTYFQFLNYVIHKSY